MRLIMNKVCYVTMNRGEFDVERMSFSNTLTAAKRRVNNNQRIVKAIIHFEDL